MDVEREATGPGRITRDASPVDLYRVLPPSGEAELIHAAVPAGASILELGCGTGRITRGLLELGHPVTGVDFSADMLAHMPKGARAVLADIESLQLDERFDAVTLTSFLVNGGDEQCLALLGAARRHLKPDGVLLVERLHPRWGNPDVLRLLSTPHTLGHITNSLHDIEGDGTTITYTVRYEHDDGRVWTVPATMVVRDDENVDRLLDRAGLQAERWLDQGRMWLLAVCAQDDTPRIRFSL